MKQLRHWIAHRKPGLKYPVWYFGGRVVVHSGQWGNIRLRKGWLVVCWRSNRRYVYYSPNGTPSRAWWGVGDYNRR